MGRRGMPGRRRQVLQLDENTKTSYLTQTGCYRPDDMFIESKNSAKTGLSLVGEYSDSESDSEEAEQTDLDVESKFNGDTQIKGEENEPVTEKNDSLQAEMLEIVGAKKETSADIFLREFQAYQKESLAPVYNREFIAFQKESKEDVENSPTSSSSKDVQKENPTKSSEDSNSLSKNNKASSSAGTKAPDIDSQVASFLAEIDALEDEEEKEKTEESNEIGTNDSSSVDHNQNGQSSMTVSDSQNGNSTITSKTAKEVEENPTAPLPPPPPPPPQEEKIVWPEEPTTEWQQCYDENTQHCYYWNINTNEVTWEIPPEFTQYLLLYREYEEKIAKLMKEGKMKPKKKKLQKKSEKNKLKQSENESDTASKDLSTVPQVEYGPHLPPSSNTQKDTCSSPETVGPANTGQESSKESMEPIFGPMLKPDTILEGNKEKGDESDASSSSSTGKHINNTARDNFDKEEDNIMDNKKSAAALATPVTDTGSPADCTDAVNVSTTCVNEGSKGDSLTADLAMIELCKKKFKARISREEESGKLSGSLSVDSGTKGNSLPTDLEEGLLDIDEVDRELELALERKKNELKSLEEEEEKQSHESVKGRGKRKYHERGASDDSSADEVSTQKSSKRSRDQRSRDHRESSKHSKKTKHKKDTNGVSSDDSSPPSTRKSRSSDQKKSHRSHQSKKESRPKKSKDMLSSKEHADSKSRSCDDAEENKLKDSALDLSLLVMDKMDFLEIDISKQSKLQVLYVQLKTRISDWQAGGLSTKYFYVKLQEANQQLGQYEKSGAPAGWSVNWDRTCKRYFYTNNTSGHSQWEYPDQLLKEEGNELPDNLSSIAGSLPLPLLPPPPPPPSSSPSLEKDALEEADKEHHKVAKDCERRERSSSEKEKYSSKSEGRKEKRSRKESKSSKSSRSKDSSKSKSHSENTSCSKLKDYDCEMSIYPGEPPPPGTEANLQPSDATMSSTSISQANSPQLDNKDPLHVAAGVEEDLEDVMNLASSLNKPAVICSSTSGLTEDVDDMEIDPEDEVPASAPAPLLPPSEFKIHSANEGSNGTVVSMPDPVISHITNSSAVISKPPHLTRSAVSAEALPVSAGSAHESTLSYSGRMDASAVDAANMSHLSSLSDLPNESSNSPKPADNNEATETIKNTKEKRKKKDKVITGTSLTLKKKNVSSLVQKWQKVKKEVEKEDELARHEFSDGD